MRPEAAVVRCGAQNRRHERWAFPSPEVGDAVFGLECSEFLRRAQTILPHPTF